LNELGEPREFVTPLELSRCCGIKPQVIYNYIRTNRIAGTRVNGKILISWAEATEYLNKRYAKEQRKAEQIERELNGL